MANVDPGDIPLPAFLDPLLSYLSSSLPPQVYSALLTILSHLLALLTALLSLFSALTASKPWEWDAQTVLPPLISLFAAYLALLSVYRTTSWMVRTTIWMVKWGALLSALAAGAGYFMGNQGAGGDVGRGGAFPGVVPTLTGFLLDLFNGQDQNAAGTQRSKSARSKSKAKSNPTNPRPKAWEPFDRHREWQFQESQNNGAQGSAAEEVQRFVTNVIGRAREGGWWEAAKSVVDGVGQGSKDGEAAEEGTRRQPDRKAKSKAKTGRQSGSR
ncbi:hypothetical protein BV25DRAFT_1824869 [Artomyces pyxidatus]|uniref:Uncharacterized protein n=1 Tax=Artomyces pyxidatus TaxID=48021 RepID=A0ACB8T220_9AGAM|nr:hypothetical protein BV25DRAFT_1824869 [Artomyces pyxidatus]